jgi:hypothetical protein
LVACVSVPGDWVDASESEAVHLVIFVDQLVVKRDEV